MSEEVLTIKIANVPLSRLRRRYAVQAVIQQQKFLLHETLLHNDTYGRDAFCHNHMLYQALGIYKDSTREQIRTAVQRKQEAKAALL